ncbi:MAG: pyridoxamine 5'-phosphate oxidase family protein [Actinomycetota bacterium]|nr:pyridoxamine 5'-phosphate oxidase family protein [Actinomycetota bacterium]
MFVTEAPSVCESLPLSPTPRTTLNRRRDRAGTDRRDLYDVLDAALVCHFGVLVDGAPLVLPTAFGFDPAGPDDGGTLYLHGSVASLSLVAARQRPICVTFTVLDGLVLARSAFHHSMNYRSAVVMGTPRTVDDPDEKSRALSLVVDHVVPGRMETLRPHTRKELAATSVLALSLAEASVKARTGDPIDDESDLQNGGWAGVIPLRVVADEVVTAADAAGHQPPADVLERAARLV